VGKYLKHVGPRLVQAHVWEEDIATAEWATKNIVMNGDVSPFPGPLDFTNTPHIEAILADWDKTHIEQHNILASTQVGKTTILFIVITKALDTDPCMMQLTIPNEKDVTDYVSGKVDPFLRGIKGLQKKLYVHKETEKVRDKTAVKRVAGGLLYILGNTAANRRSKTVKYKFIDEAALFGKGHIEELIGRTKSFEKAFRKIFIVSSPKHKGDEMIAAYENSYCKKEWRMECPSCNTYFYPDSKKFKYMTMKEYADEQGVTEVDENAYKREAEKTAHIKCDCGYKITSREKDALIRARKVRFDIIEGSEEDKTVGYRINALGTYITNFSTIARLLIEAELSLDEEKLETIYQDYFAEVYERKYEEIDENSMLSLGNGLPTWEVPENTYKIYMGVDMQKDHFWYEVKAYCYGNVSHSIAHGRLESFADIEDIWEHGQELYDADGGYHVISKMGIDRRGFNQDGARRTDDVDAFVEYMVSKYKNGDENRIYATEGHPSLTGDKPFIISTMKDYSNNRKQLDIKVIKLSNIYLKHSVNRAIERTILKETALSEEDEGYDYAAKLFYINQDTIDADRQGTTQKSYTRQLTAETFDYAVNPKTGRKDTVKTWINPHNRDNHFFDTSVICEAFAEIDKVMLQRQIEATSIAKSLSGLASLHS